MSYGSLEELRDAVQEHAGVLTVLVAEIRDAYGAERLGSRVRDEIIGKLKSLALMHRPRRFPSYQEDQVRLFIEDSPAGRLILDVENLGSPSDKRIRTAASGEEVMQHIRELIGAN